MLDLVIRGGQVVAPWGGGPWDVAVQGDKIVAVAEPETLPDDVGRVLDATGKIVIPGGIEPHAHASMPLPYPGPRSQGLTSGSPEVISQAAIFGGTTTVVDFANWRQGSDLAEAIERKDAVFKGHSYADYSFHCILVGMGTEGSTPQGTCGIAPFCHRPD